MDLTKLYAESTQPPSPLYITASTPLMVVSAPSTTLLAAAAVVSSAAKALAVGSIGAVAVLVGSGSTTHAVSTAAVDIVALVVARVSAIDAAHLRCLGRGESAALRSGGVVVDRTGSSTAKRRRRTGSSLGIAKRLQVISRCARVGLGLAVEGLALRLERRAAAGKAVVGATKAASSQAGLRTSLRSGSTAVIAQARAEAGITVTARGSKVGRRRGMVVWCVGSATVWLTVHANLAVWAKATLSVARVVLLVVRVVGVVVAGVLLAVALRLRAGDTLCLLLLSLLSLLSLLLSLGSGVRGRVAAVLCVGSGTEARLRVRASALGVLAQAISLSSVVAAHALLYIVLAVDTLLLTELLTVVVVWVTVLLVRGVVVGVVTGRGAESTLRRRLRGGREAVERRLRNGGSLLVEGVDRLLGTRSILRGGLAEAVKLLSGRHGGLHTYEIVSATLLTR